MYDWQLLKATEKKPGVCIGNCTFQWFSSFVDQSALLQNALQANAQHHTKKEMSFWPDVSVVPTFQSLQLRYIYIFDNHDDSIRTDNFLISHVKCRQVQTDHSELCQKMPELAYLNN